MFKYQKYNYVLFGNPISHSKSPQIHNFFSKQTGLCHEYQAIHVPLNLFSVFFSDFFKKYGRGANITAPFKKEAYFLCDQLTERAEIAQSVNTFKKIDDQYILGDNTDGIGLLSDLQRLNFIQKKYSILIIGAGGAAKGIIFPLLSFGCSIFILNRTLSNAKKLVWQFKNYGDINIFDKYSSNINMFDLVINATSNSFEQPKDMIPLSLLSSNTFFYDMNYDSNHTFFVHWCIKTGFSLIANGIGMLVLQAAHSFYLWYNVFPETDYIIERLNKKDTI